MARIRSIKPEFWTSEQVMECSPITRLLFIGMWNFADDAGRLPFSPKTIKAQIFPGDAITCDDVSGMVAELSANGLVSSYVVEGKQYLLITGWKHQKIDKPQKPKYPEPGELSANIPRMVSTDRIGEEGIGRDSAVADATHPKISPVDPQARYFDRAVEILGPNGRGFAAKLLKAKGGVVSLALSALELADGKSDAKEYLGAIIRNREQPAPKDRTDRSW